MEILTGDIVRLKKKHPCGSFDWEVLRSGADFRLKCCGCEHQVMMARKLVEKNIRRLERNGDEIRSILEVSSEQLRKFYIIIMKKSACFALFFMVNWITVICYILIPCSPQWEGREVQKEVH